MDHWYLNLIPKSTSFRNNIEADAAGRDSEAVDTLLACLRLLLADRRVAAIHCYRSAVGHGVCTVAPTGSYAVLQGGPAANCHVGVAVP